MPTHPVHPKFLIWIHLASGGLGNISVLVVYVFVRFLEQKLISALSDPNVLQIRIGLSILKFSDLFQAIINLLTVESGGFNSGRFCFAARQSGGLRGECTLWYMTRASRDFNHATEQNQLNFS